VAGSDAEARAIVEAARRAGRPVPAIGFLGGDLARTLGATGDEARLRSDEAMTLPVDVGAVLVDGRLHWFVAHLVARRRFWQGSFAVAMNAEWCGRLSLGPRSHPGDGLLDVTTGSLSWGDRVKARRRARTGDHLPHPDLRTERTAATQLEFERPVDIWLDGQRIGTARTLSLRVEDAALPAVV
jgi:diacylglycerol kinase family enzyme